VNMCIYQTRDKKFAASVDDFGYLWVI